MHPFWGAYFVFYGYLRNMIQLSWIIISGNHHRSRWSSYPVIIIVHGGHRRTVIIVVRSSSLHGHHRHRVAPYAGIQNPFRIWGSPEFLICDDVSSADTRSRRDVVLS